MSGLAEERENALRGRVGLREHARAGLLQDLELREIDHLAGHVHVADPALRRDQVLLVGREVVEAVLEAGFHPAQLRTGARHALYLGGDVGEGTRRPGLRW